MAQSACWIGIDPSYTAYAMVRLYSDDTFDAETVVFSPKLVGHGSRRLDAIFRILQLKFETVASCFDVRAVALEGYAIQSKFGREVAGELGGLTKVLSMRELRKPPIIVPPTSLKKFVTGTGKADKDMMKAGVAEKWGESFKSHDLADAYGLARMAKASQRGTADENEKIVLAAITGRNAM